jgi:hypothetical protein
MTKQTTVSLRPVRFVRDVVVHGVDVDPGRIDVELDAAPSSRLTRAVL